jgi:5-(carboxyamino)imidazole ribonucleotide mutase
MVIFLGISEFLAIFVKKKIMQAMVSIIMGSTSDLAIMEAAATFLNDMQIPFEINALSAHRTPEKVEEFARGAHGRGIRVIIAAAGMAAHLPGVIAAMTSVPVIGVPVKATLEGLDSLLAIVQMPPGIPVATVGINASMNAAILSAEILAVSDPALYQKLVMFKEDLKKKIVKANEELAKVKYDYKVG